MPTVSDLDAAMTQPARFVPAIPRLGGGMIRLNDAGRPVRAIGRDAVVYELRTPIGRILALRCLLRPDSERDRTLAKRYAALREDPRLQSLRGPDGPLPRDIHWMAEGVALPDPDPQRPTAPLLAMERVPGRTLVRAVDRLCHAAEQEPLALLADCWLATATLLEGARFIHGDLAADNLMVRPDGTIAVIDLDTAFWPSGPPAPPPAGTPGYIHPRGAPRDPARRDRFPALILWASLRILARHPDLRQRWGDPPDHLGATLLWAEDDLRHPAQSALVAALDALDDPTLRPLLEIVRRAIRFSPDETPPLSEIAVRLDTLGFPRLASSPAQGSRGWAPRHAPESTPATPQESVDAQHGSDLFQGSRHEAAPSATVPVQRSPDEESTALRAERERRTAAVQQLGAAVAARDVATAARLWSESRAMAEAAPYATAVHGLIAEELTAMIERAMRRNDDAALIAAVAEAERAGVAPSHQARAAARAARERISTRSTLVEAVAVNDYPTIAGLKLAGKLDGLGRLDPRYERAVARSLAWPALERALASDDDVAIATAADPALWRDEGTLPEAAWQRLDLARRRLRWAEDVRAALRRRDGVALGALLAGAPPGAHERLTVVENRRIQRVTAREAAVARLERALREGPDREVVAALAEFESAGAPFSDVLDWAAVRGVVDRITLADAIRAATTADPPDTARLARLLPAARAALGSDAEGGPDWAALERSVLRAAHLARLREAIASGDDGRITFAAAPDPYGANGLLTAEERDRVQRAIANRRHLPGDPP